MAGLRRSFRWPHENKKTITVAVPRSESGFGFTVAWTKPPLVDYIHEGGNAEKAGLMPGDKIICIDKVKVSKKGKEEIENIVKNVKGIMELEISRQDSELASRKRQTSLRRKESFTKKGSKMIIQDCNIMLWRRERALLKLLLCEEDLLSAIAQGKERFISVLRKRCSLATPMELNILFGNIEEHINASGGMAEFPYLMTYPPSGNNFGDFGDKIPIRGFTTYPSAPCPYG